MEKIKKEFSFRFMQEDKELHKATWSRKGKQNVVINTWEIKTMQATEDEQMEAAGQAVAVDFKSRTRFQKENDNQPKQA